MKRARMLEKLTKMALKLYDNFTWPGYYEVFTACSDWNSEHPDEEIFMCEMWKADGHEHDGLMIEDDVFYYEED